MSRVMRDLRRVALATPLALVGLAVSAGASEAPTSVMVGGSPVSAHVASVGALAGSARLRLTVVLAPRHAGALATLAAAVSDPASASYHHYLTVAQFAARFGAGAGAVRALRETLRADGLEPGALARDGLSIAVSGSAAAASRTFDVRLRRYRERSGLQVYANTSAPRVPAALGGIVEDVLGLDDLPSDAPASLAAIPSQPVVPPAAPRTVAHTASQFPGGGGPVPCAAASSFAAANSGLATIDQVGKAYGFDGLYAAGDFGQGVTVALLELEPYTTEASDLAEFQQCFGTDAQITDYGSSPFTEQTAETAVDLENLIGLAPDVKVDVYYGPNGGSGQYETLVAAVDSPQHAQVISNSWGLCEPDSDQATVNAENGLLEQAELQGQSFISSSGDRGAEGCTSDWNNDLGSNGAGELAVDDPASQPYATAVGGTTLNAIGPPPTQSNWNELYWGASGGGISAIWPMQYWQFDSGVPGVLNSYSSPTPCGQTSGYCREVPDVSADGSTLSGYATYYQGSWSGWGGTSTAAPDWAALAALADSTANPYAGCSANAPLGFLNPLLYEVAAGDDHADAFSDITGGNNSGYFDGADPYGPYPVTAGYDMATGLGTPIATDGSSPGLVEQLCAANATPVPPPSQIASLSAAEAAPGTAITITGTNFTQFAAVWFGSVPASSVTYDSPTQLTATVPPGSGSVSVTVIKLTGVSPASSADAFTYAPTATIASPSAGATYTQGQSLSASYSCADSTAGTPACSGTLPSGGAVDTAAVGAHQFSVTATDANGFSTTATADYTVVAPPSIAISGLSSGGTYAQGQALSAHVSCTTSAPLTIESCTAPSAVDTGAAGTHSFSVAATDSNGVTTTEVITYTVVALPAATIHTPASGAFYLLGQHVVASYACAAVAPAHIVSCTAPTANGHAVNTATLGLHRFALTATDSFAVSSTASANYTVVSVQAKLTDVHQEAERWVERGVSGTRATVGTRFSFSLDQPARVTLSFARNAGGRVAAGRCVDPAHAAPAAQPCTRSIRAGTLTVTGEPGANTLSFSGRTSAGILAPGVYTVVVRATGLGGRASVAALLLFTIAPAKA